MGARGAYCPSYDAFNHCKFGYDKCRLRKFHQKSIYQQEFFFATISLGSSPGFVWATHHDSGRSEEFFVFVVDRRDADDVKQGEIVLFQASSKRSREYLRHGRVLANFGAVHYHGESIPIESCRMSGFTIDPPGTRCREDAVTIEDCRDHRICKKIGIHVIAAALQTLSKLPFYGKFTKLFLAEKSSFERDQVTTAISIYVHTNAETINGPIFTPVVVKENYTFDRKYEYQEMFDILWNKFVGKFEVGKIFNESWARGSLFNLEKSWKEQLLFDLMIGAYNDAVTAYSSTYTGRFFITKSVKSPPKMTTKEHTIVTTFKDLYIDARNAIVKEKQRDPTTARQSDSTIDNQNGTDYKIMLAMSSAMRSQNIANFSDPIFPAKYECNVETVAATKDSVLKSSSPLRKLPNFVNQQILIRCMLGSKRNEELYTEKDLLGLLGIRFRTPQLYCALIKEVRREEILLDYPSSGAIDRSLHIINCDNFPAMDKNGKITFKGISCLDGDYCNRALALFDWEEFENLERKMRESGEISAEVKNLFENINIVEEDSPYEREGENTILTLRSSAELQLQASNSDAEQHNDLGLRLLRIGKNCHLCFTHVNHPEKAFMSDRKDIRRLINTERIMSLKQARKAGCLKSVVLKNVRIAWDGKYFAGGSFKKEECVVDVGDLLCIRTEVPTHGKVMCVWTCHGIVYHTDDEGVKFSVCTLSQASNDLGTETFCVEIIKSPSLDGHEEASTMTVCETEIHR